MRYRRNVDVNVSLPRVSVRTGHPPSNLTESIVFPTPACPLNRSSPLRMSTPQASSTRDAIPTAPGRSLSRCGSQEIEGGERVLEFSSSDIVHASHELKRGGIAVRGRDGVNWWSAGGDKGWHLGRVVSEGERRGARERSNQARRIDQQARSERYARWREMRRNSAASTTVNSASGLSGALRRISREGGVSTGR